MFTGRDSGIDKEPRVRTGIHRTSVSKIRQIGCWGTQVSVGTDVHSRYTRVRMGPDVNRTG